MEKHALHVSIIGGGIGGLTAASAFQRQGIQVTRFERNPDLREIGADLTLWANGVQILDWPHLYRKIRDVVRSVRPGKRADRRAWRKHQYDLLFPWLWEGQCEQALAPLRSLRPAQGEPPPALESAIQYLSTQGDWIGDYRLWKEQGYAVGSGLVERAIAVVINGRMKKRGMRRIRENARHQC